MDKPTSTDYVQLLYNLFDRFMQQHPLPVQRGHPFEYRHKLLIAFFTIMHMKHIFQFQTQWRWLTTHSEDRHQLGFETVPHRTTLERRYKQLYTLLQLFIVFVGETAEPLGQTFASHDLNEDKSLFKAQGPVWHQSDREIGRIPEKLRHLDTDATWSKSGYHGWVYGYGFHLTCNQAGFPKLIQVETAAISESQVLNDKETFLLHHLCPDSLTADNSYTQAMRIRAWANDGVALLTPALKWVQGKYAKAYHKFIHEDLNARLLQNRRTAIEPIFDLIAKLIGATANHKQLSIQRLINVRTCLALATLALQLTMVANSIWNLPTRDISHFLATFA